MGKMEYNHTDVERLAYADASGVLVGTKCYGIGVFSIQASRHPEFEKWFERLKKKHKISGELDWDSIANNSNDVDFVIELADKILCSRGGYFDIIVVNTNMYRKWMRSDSDKEGAFYVTYTHLLESVAKRGSMISEVFIADRTDAYPKQNEVMEIVANNMLARGDVHGRVGQVRKVSSTLTPGVQVADLLTGLVVAGHMRHLGCSAELNEGKCRAIEQVARLLGWKDLCFDTFPNAKFNIWHFPKEYRNNPRTMDVRIRTPRSKVVSTPK